MTMLVKSGTTRDRTAYREDYNTGTKTRNTLEFIGKNGCSLLAFSTSHILGITMNTCLPNIARFDVEIN